VVAFVPARAGDEANVVGTLVSAFVEDPWERWAWPQPQDYFAHFPTFVAAFGGPAFAQQTVWMLPDFAAVAMWMPPGFPHSGADVARSDHGASLMTDFSSGDWSVGGPQSFPLHLIRVGESGCTVLASHEVAVIGGRVNDTQERYAIVRTVCRFEFTVRQPARHIPRAPVNEDSCGALPVQRRQARRASPRLARGADSLGRPYGRQERR
jgi:hypothetical protein